MCTKYLAGLINKPTFLWWEFVSDLNISTLGQEIVLHSLQVIHRFPNHRIKTTLFPDLTSFKPIASCFVTNKNYGLLRELPATSKTIFFVYQVAVDSQVY
jgi:hypothetical protein